MERFVMMLMVMLMLLAAAGCGGVETEIIEEGQRIPLSPAEETAPRETEEAETDIIEEAREIQVTTPEEIVPVETDYPDDFPAAYRSVIEKYRAVKEEGIRAVECYSHDVSVLAVSDDDKGYAVDLGYALIDLDGDGIEELIIAGFDTESFRENVLFDLYTLKDGQPTRLIIGLPKSRPYLTASYLIYNKGFNGADKSLNYIYRLEDGELILEEGFLSKWDGEEKAIVWYYTNDEDYNFANDTRIDTEEAKARIAAYESSAYLPPLTKIN